MNKQRLYDLIKNIKETLALLDKALLKLNEIEDGDLNTLIKSSVKQSFLEYFILIESFTSMCLKELKIYKISDDMEKSLTKLNENKIIDLDMLSFLNNYRRYRNRIAHVYKQPSIEEIISFLETNNDKMYEVVNIMTEMWIKL
ncbi:HepT-like ribonuclease domain-containing protein [uncultured Clostridium sp.]|uniref:HepT-like ribonuclease domain-containing protein n=1 Tax=uncultured Clostridium sp. TaxID=59620 RepID=UPI0028E56DCC|nr:HepT-like ribonuclease domain-containing protein [uncultured Clostridium sp.]